MTRNMGNTATQRQKDNPTGGIISTTPRPMIVLPDHAMAVITISRYPWLDSHFINITVNPVVDLRQEISHLFDAVIVICRIRDWTSKLM